MKQLSFLLITVILCTGLTSVSIAESKEFDRHFKLLPKPQKIELFPGKPFLANDLRFIYLEGGTKKPVLNQPLGSLPVAESPGKGVLTLSLSQSEDLPSSNEGYILTVKDNQIKITSRGEAGLFYGCQTLQQLLEDAKDQQVGITPCLITDWPEIPYRAVHVDIKYHLDNELYYYQMIDRLAGLKVNAVIIEFEDKLRYRKAPEIGAYNSISIDEFGAISRYAHERNIEISPLVQGLGHVSFILKHDEYKNLRDNPDIDWVFDPLNPETYKLQFALYEDAIAATPYGKYLHVGGDEVRNYGNYALGQKSGKNPFELQMYWLNKVCEFASEHNRIPIFWDDMLLKYSGLINTTESLSLSNEQIEKIWKENQYRLDENINLFPKNCVYMRWAYSNPQVLGNVKAMEWYKSHGLKVMGAPAAQNMSAMLPRDNSIFKPIQQFCRVATEIDIDGLLCTLWDDSSPHFETFWRGLYYYAALSWNYEDIEPAYAQMIFRHRFYAPELSDSSFEFQDQLELALNFWDTALLNKGRRTHYFMNTELISLPDINKPGDWSRKYKEKISRAEMEIERYKTIKNKIEKATKLTRRNYYSLALMNQINELQIYPSNLLLFLDKYDRASSADKKTKARFELLSYIDKFIDIRKAYEDVFSETRFLKNPDGYILDQNLDFMLANGTNNSDWMYLYELKMNNMIKQLLKN
ncbi:MAG: beta-N-acetylhexosaminidase [Bacteroidales bacterium]|nr:beta-N-acetylhexosaminidase [Bacteroidales bacterium]